MVLRIDCQTSRQDGRSTLGLVEIYRNSVTKYCSSKETDNGNPTTRFHCMRFNPNRGKKYMPSTASQEILFLDSSREQLAETGHNNL